MIPEQRVFLARIEFEFHLRILVVPLISVRFVIDDVFGTPDVEYRILGTFEDEDAGCVFPSFDIHPHFHTADGQALAVDEKPAAELDFFNIRLLVEGYDIVHPLTEIIHRLHGELVIVEDFREKNGGKGILGLIDLQDGCQAALILDEQGIGAVVVLAAATFIDTRTVDLKGRIRCFIDIYNSLIHSEISVRTLFYEFPVKCGHADIFVRIVLLDAVQRGQDQFHRILGTDECRVERQTDGRKDDLVGIIVCKSFKIRDFKSLRGVSQVTDRYNGRRQGPGIDLEGEESFRIGHVRDVRP